MAPPPKDLPPQYLALAEAAGVAISTQIELQNATGLSPSTLTDFLAGRRNAKPTTYRLVARALNVSEADLREARDGVPGDLGPFEVPPNAHLLTKRQRTAVLAIIDELAGSQRRLLGLDDAEVPRSRVARRGRGLGPDGRGAEEGHGGSASASGQ